jgi:hypoxanthine phosphoribosyltransferase
VSFYQDQVDTLIDQNALERRVEQMGEQLTRDYQGKPLTLLGVLKGSIFFLADLARRIDLPLTVELLGISSYQGRTTTSGEVRITSDVTKPMAGKHVLVVEDIIDTGLSMKFLLDNLQARQPASVKVCALLHKPSRARTKVALDYVGFTVEDHFVVGYGLDFAEQYRNLPFIGVLKAPVSAP